MFFNPLFFAQNGADFYSRALKRVDDFVLPPFAEEWEHFEERALKVYISSCEKS